MSSEANFFDIYNHRILDLAGNIPRQGRLAAPDATATAHSKLCGSTVVVDLVMTDGQVVDFAQDVKACALGQAAASIMARHVIGATGPELRALRDQVRAMLKENGPPPQGKWADCRHPRAGARFQGPARLDPAHLRRDGRLRQPDRSRVPARGAVPRPGPHNDLIRIRSNEGIGDNDAGREIIERAEPVGMGLAPALSRSD